jgi:hypothetical protein
MNPSATVINLEEAAGVGDRFFGRRIQFQLVVSFDLSFKDVSVLEIDEVCLRFRSKSNAAKTNKEPPKFREE